MSDSKFDRKTLEAQLQQLSAQIAELVTKLETAVGREAEALRPKLKAAQEQLQELKQRSAEAWDDLKPGMKKAWDELSKSLNQAATRFKTRPKQ
jgi:chromosome segregation ATPase